MLFIPMLTRRAERRIARFIGWLVWRLRLEYCRIARDNVDMICGDMRTDAQKEAFLKKVFEHAGLVVMDYFWFSRHVKKRVLTYCEVGDDISRRWVEEDFPGVFCTAHFGNWELGGHFISEHGRRLWSVFKPMGCRAVSKGLLSFRGRSGQHVIEREGAMIGVLRALRAKDVVAMVLDQHTELPDGGVYADFFGKPATFSLSVGTLSHRLHVPILIAGMVYHPDRDRYVMTTIREITAEEAARMTPEEITMAIRDGFETMIRRHPDQWLWMYRRWKRYRPCDNPAEFPAYARIDAYATADTPCLPGGSCFPPNRAV